MATLVELLMVLLVFLLLVYERLNFLKALGYLVDGFIESLNGILIGWRHVCECQYNCVVLEFLALTLDVAEGDLYVLHLFSGEFFHFSMWQVV